MFKKALDYTSKYRKTSYAAIAFMLVGVTMTVIPYFIAYQLIVSLLGYGELTSVYHCKKSWRCSRWEPYKAKEPAR